MDANTALEHLNGIIPSFFKRPQVQKEIIPVAGGIPFGIERVSNPEVGIGGAYGTWGDSYDNTSLLALVAKRLGKWLDEPDKMNLSELGFVNRHHVQGLSEAEHIELELEVG